MKGDREEVRGNRPGFFRRLSSVPHLFGKLIVIWCVSFGTLASVWALRILSRTGHDPAALLGVILAFFGGELLFMCLRAFLNKDKKE